MKELIILFGKPGAGKSTRLSEFLKGKEEKYQVLSVGKLLRRAIKEQSELGKKAQFYIENRELVPDDIINKLVIDELKTSNKAVITDGFPRTVEQAEAILNVCIIPNTIVIHFYVDDEVATKRIKNRIICGKCGETYSTNKFKAPKHGVCDKCGGELCRRTDDKDEVVVRRRLQVYENETYPVLNVFKKAGVAIFTTNNT